MAFCNSCGTALLPGANACNKCGASVTAVPGAAVPVPPAPPQGPSALKIVLIVVAAIFCVGLLCLLAIGFVGYRFAKNTHVTQEGDRVRIDTPVGTVMANDPEDVARELGGEIYPGAEVKKNGASSMTIAGVHTVTANFTTADSAEKVCAFYKSKFPNATVTSSGSHRCSIVSNRGSGGQQDMFTVNVEDASSGASFQIAHVTKGSADGSN